MCFDYAGEPLTLQETFLYYLKSMLLWSKKFKESELCLKHYLRSKTFLTTAVSMGPAVEATLDPHRKLPSFL